MNSHMWLVVTVYRVGLELKKKKDGGQITSVLSWQEKKIV